MPTIELTDDEFETLREAFDDVGNDCPGVDLDKFKALEIKLGFREAEKPLTEEELKKREEFNNSSYMKQMRELIAASNHLLKDIVFSDIDVLYGQKNISPIATELRIKLPNDYSVKK